MLENDQIWGYNSRGKANALNSNKRGPADNEVLALFSNMLAAQNPCGVLLSVSR